MHRTARLRQAATHALWTALELSGLTALSRRLADRAPVLCFHNVISGPYLNDEQSLHMRREAFEPLMEWIAATLRVVPLEELVDRQRRGRSLRGLASVTFDDAYRGVFINAVPILERLRLPATVFVPTRAAQNGQTFWWDWPAVGRLAQDPATRERLLGTCQGDGDRIRMHLGVTPTELGGEYAPSTWQALATADRTLIAFGSHTVDHRCLTSLPDDQIARELAESRDAMRDHLGEPPRYVAYPYGAADARVARAAEEAGYEAGFTLGPQRVRAADGRHLLPRINVPGLISPVAFRGWASGYARG